MILTYKYRIKDRSAKNTLRRHAYAANQVWNWCVAQQRDTQARYHAGAKPRKWVTHFDLQKLCKGDFAKARDKSGRAPRFRSSFGTKRALGWVPFEKQSRQTRGTSVTYLGKRYRFWEGDRPLPQNAKGGCFVEDALSRWYVCFYVEVEVREVGNGAIGIDLGLKSLATLSDGRKIEAPQHYRVHEQRLAVAQRAGNKQRVRRIHAKIKNCRQDFLHKETTKLHREHAFIAVGNVNSLQLARTRMAKSVLDASWSTFRSMLKYKSAGYREVDEKFTTQTCSECGSLPPSRPKGIAGLEIREWECSDCGASLDRDVNAARNILALALSVERPAEESRRVPCHKM